MYLGSISRARELADIRLPHLDLQTSDRPERKDQDASLRLLDLAIEPKVIAGALTECQHRKIHTSTTNVLKQVLSPQIMVCDILARYHPFAAGRRYCADASRQTQKVIADFEKLKGFVPHHAAPLPKYQDVTHALQEVEVDGNCTIGMLHIKADDLSYFKSIFTTWEKVDPDMPLQQLVALRHAPMEVHVNILPETTPLCNSRGDCNLHFQIRTKRRFLKWLSGQSYAHLSLIRNKSDWSYISGVRQAPFEIAVHEINHGLLLMYARKVADLLISIPYGKLTNLEEARVILAPEYTLSSQCKHSYRLDHGHNAVYITTEDIEGKIPVIPYTCGKTKRIKYLRKGESITGSVRGITPDGDGFTIVNHSGEIHISGILRLHNKPQSLSDAASMIGQNPLSTLKECLDKDIPVKVSHINGENEYWPYLKIKKKVLA